MRPISLDCFRVRLISHEVINRIDHPNEFLVFMVHRGDAKGITVFPLKQRHRLILLAPMQQLSDPEDVQDMARLAVERAEKHLEDYPDNQRAYYLCLGPLTLLGENDRALEWAESAYRLAPDDPATRYNLACFYSLVGDVDKALDLLEDSVKSRGWIDHDLDNLRDHPRFQLFLESLPLVN